MTNELTPTPQMDAVERDRYGLDAKERNYEEIVRRWTRQRTMAFETGPYAIIAIDALRARIDELTASNDVLRIERDSARQAAHHNAMTANTFHRELTREKERCVAAMASAEEWIDKEAAARAEVERLRAALESIKLTCVYAHPSPLSPLTGIKKIASAALAPTPDTHNSPGEGDHIKRDEAGR